MTSSNHLQRGRPEPIREIPVRPSRVIHFCPAAQREAGRQAARAVAHRRHLAGQPGRRNPDGRQSSGAGRRGQDGPDARFRRHPVLDAHQQSRLAVGARRSHHAGRRDRRQARCRDGAQGGRSRRHPLRRSTARPARGTRRAAEATDVARDSRNRTRRNERRGDLCCVAAHAGVVVRPCRSGSESTDENDARWWRPSRLSRARRSERRQRRAAHLPARPVALHDRAHGRRLCDVRATAVLRTVRRYPRHGRVRRPIPQCIPARLRRRVEPASVADRHRQACLHAAASRRAAGAARDRRDGRRHWRNHARRQDGRRCVGEAVSASSCRWLASWQHAIPSSPKSYGF